MTISQTTARIAAVAAGVTYLALGVASLTGAVPDEHWGAFGTLIDQLGLIGFAATILGVEVLPTALGLQRLGVVGVRISQVGLTAMSVESVASLVHEGNIISPVFFVGLLATLLGLLVAGIDGLRRPGARWVALLPFLSLFVGVGAGEHGGFVLPGLVWLLLGATTMGAAASGQSRQNSLPSGSAITR